MQPGRRIRDDGGASDIIGAKGLHRPLDAAARKEPYASSAAPLPLHLASIHLQGNDAELQAVGEWEI